MINDLEKILKPKNSFHSQELIRGVSIDSRRTKPGELFFALKGEHTDGHLYLNDALKRGAVGCVVEKSMNTEKEIIVDDTLFALGEFARFYRSRFHPCTIAITGTNGKTTVKNLIAKILEKKFRILYTKKNYNSLIGVPLTIIELNGNEEFLVLEMGTSNPGEIKRLCEIARPDIGVITNIGPGHLKGLKSLEGVREEKLSLIHALPDNGFAVLGENVTDEISQRFIKFSLNDCKDIRLTEYGSHFTYKEKKFFTPLLGLANVYNCLAAIIVTTMLNIDYQTQYTALTETAPTPGRMEPLWLKNLLIINDTYNANPASMKNALNFVNEIKRRKIVVLGDMLELGENSKELHIEIGEYAHRIGALLLTYGTDAKYYGGKHFKDRKKLLQYLLKKIEGNEVILFKASRALQFELIVNELMKELR